MKEGKKEKKRKSMNVAPGEEEEEEIENERKGQGGHALGDNFCIGEAKMLQQILEQSRNFLRVPNGQEL